MREGLVCAWEHGRQKEKKQLRQARLVRRALIKEKRAPAIIYFLFLEFSRQAREKRDFLGRWNEVNGLTCSVLIKTFKKNKWNV